MKPEFPAVKVEGQGQIFENPVLESLTKTNPWITAFTYLGTSAILIVYGFQYNHLDITKALGLFISGLFFWTFFEYVTHRFVFHYVNERKWVQKFHYAMHGVHHEYPKDRERIFMPPVPGLLITSLLFGIFYLIMGAWVFAFLPGLLVGYYLYSFIHWSVHKNKPPKWLKPQWRHHSLHHYKYTELAFGVTTRFWDRVFGTMPPEK